MNEILYSLRNNGFATIDYVVFAVYVLILVVTGIALGRSKKNEKKSSYDYFLAGNTLSWWAIGTSLIAANISAEHFIGMTGSAYASGIAQAAYEIIAVLALILVAKFLLPIMIERKVMTIPQFIRERYNWGVGFAFAILWLFLYIFINMTSVAWLGAMAIQHILALPGNIMIPFMGMEVDAVRLVIILALFMITAIYSLRGGQASVAWTDAIQVTLFIGGGLITSYATLKVIGHEMNIDGGVWGTMTHIYDYFQTLPTDHHFNLIVTRNEALYPAIEGIKDASGNVLQPEDPFYTNPGIVLIVGAIWLTNIGYWAFNQYTIQKGLSAKNLDHAKKGLLFAAFLKLLIPFIICLPGLCTYYVINAEECVGLRQILHGNLTRPDDAYPYLIYNFTPVFVKGLSLAAITAAVISSLASMVNSTSALFTLDIYKQHINKGASEQKLVRVGRISATVAMLMALATMYPLLGKIDQAFQFIQEYSSFVYPGIVILVTLGLTWKRASSTAAVVVAIGTFAISILFKIAFPTIPFQTRAGMVFIILSIVFVWISVHCGKVTTATELDSKTTRNMLRWSNGFYSLSAFFGAILVMSAFNPVLQAYGCTGAMLFISSASCLIAYFLRSNAKDSVQDAHSIPIYSGIFSTSFIFNIVALVLIACVLALYILFW